MKINIDFAEVVRAASELPEEIGSPDEVGDDVFRSLYTETDGRYVLDRQGHRAMVMQLTAAAERDQLEEENRRLKDQQKRSRVVETVRQSLTKAGVKPELMDGAVAHFISRHKFCLKDERVIVEGKIGTTDAEMAAVRWIATDGEPYAAPARTALTGGFFEMVASLKKIH